MINNWAIFFSVNRPDYVDLGFVDICPLNPVEIIMDLALQEVDLMVAWTYKVPGFKELDREDQASLLSSGKLENGSEKSIF